MGNDEVNRRWPGVSSDRRVEDRGCEWGGMGQRESMD